MIANDLVAARGRFHLALLLLLLLLVIRHKANAFKDRSTWYALLLCFTPSLCHMAVDKVATA